MKWRVASYIVNNATGDRTANQRIEMLEGTLEYFTQNTFQLEGKSEHLSCLLFGVETAALFGQL
jgi:hypothetical protein